jgi:predicted ATPase
MAFLDMLESIEYVGAMRLAPERTYQYTGEAHNRVGAHGQNWASMFAFASNQKSRDGTIATDLNAWLKAAGLAARVGIEWLSDRHYEIRVQHPVSREYENLADVGQGNSQVLPVLVAGFSLPRASALMVEEPEIHLHPRAQAELGGFFYTLYRRGVQSLIETHSEYLVLRLQRHVAAGDIPPEDIVFYYVQARGQVKRVTKLQLNEKGVFVKPLPGGFFPERMDEAKALARLRGHSE